MDEQDMQIWKRRCWFCKQSKEGAFDAKSRPVFKVVEILNAVGAIFDTFH